MKKNVGGMDRNARAVVGSLLVLVGAAGYMGMVQVAFGPFPQALTAILVILVGAILLATAYTRKCPINSAVGIDTSER